MARTNGVFRTRYTVEGVPPIPLDMLRYDASFPATENDARKAERDNGERVLVELSHVHGEREWFGPNADRWASFLWRVVSVGDTERIGW